MYECICAGVGRCKVISRLGMSFDLPFGVAGATASLKCDSVPEGTIIVDKDSSMEAVIVKSVVN